MTSGGEPIGGPELSVVVLAFDERQNLRPAAAELLAALDKLGAPFELLIIDDGSTDGTGALADDLAAERSEIRVIHHPTNLGLGGGYRTGFSEARGRYLTFFPADGQFPAEIVAAFHPLMADLDLVLGFLPERASSPIAKGLSLAERLLYRALFGPIPRFQGILMFRRAMLDEITLTATGRGWGILMEFVIRVVRGPYRVRSVPTASRARLSGQSKVNNLRSIRSNLTQAFALWRIL